MKVFKLIILLFTVQLFAQKAELVLPKGASYRVSKDGHVVMLEDHKKVTIYEPKTFKKQNEFNFNLKVNLSSVNDDASVVEFKNIKKKPQKDEYVYFTLSNGKDLVGSKKEIVKKDEELKDGFDDLRKELGLDNSDLTAFYKFKNKTVICYNKRIKKGVYDVVVLVSDFITKKNDFFVVENDKFLEARDIYDANSETITFFTRTLHKYSLRDRKKDNISKDNGVETKYITYDFKGKLINEKHLNSSIDPELKNLTFNSNFYNKRLVYSQTTCHTSNGVTVCVTTFYSTIYNHEMIYEHGENLYGVAYLGDIKGSSKKPTFLQVTKYDTKGKTLSATKIPLTSKKGFGELQQTTIDVAFIKDELMLSIEYSKGNVKTGNAIKIFEGDLATLKFEEKDLNIKKMNKKTGLITLKNLNPNLNLSVLTLKLLKQNKEVEKFLQSVNTDSKKEVYTEGYGDGYYLRVLQKKEVLIQL